MASLLALAACGGGSGGVDGGPDTPAIDSIAPDYGSLLGGTKIVLTGHGFLNAGASPNHVVVGEVEALGATVIDDQNLEVVLPPGEAPGDADITVFNSNGYTTATGMFHYSTGPEITGVSPDEVVYTDETTITVTGSGFLDEGAGVNTVMVGGAPALDVEVESDTSLTFTVVGGPPLGAPDIEVSNKRGSTIEPNALTLKVSENPGLLLFSRNGSTFATFFDTVTLGLTPIPLRASLGPNARFRSALANSDGSFWGNVGLGCCWGSPDGAFVKFDPGTQIISDSKDIGFRVVEMARVGDTVYAVNPENRFFGTFDPETGTFVTLGLALPTCCAGSGVGLAANSAGTMFIAHGNSFSQVNLTTGALSNTVSFSPAIRVHGMRFIGDVLYAYSDTANNVVTINTTTGATTVVATPGLLVSTIESLE